MTSARRPAFAVAAVLFGVAATATAQRRTADDILRAYDAVTYPTWSEDSDPESLRRFDQAVADAAAQQQRLALELRNADPKHARVPELMRRRWTLFTTVQADAATVMEETARVKPEDGAELVRAAAGTRALAAATTLKTDFAGREKIARECFAAAPGDDLVEHALCDLVQYGTASTAAQRALLALVEASPAAGEEPSRRRKALARLRDAVGARFDLSLPDAAANADGPVPASTRDAAGRVLVVTFEGDAGDWVSECDRAEAAAFEALRRRFDPAAFLPFAIVSTHADKPKADAVAELRRRGVQRGVYLDRADFERTMARASFGAAEAPLHVVVDRDGRIAAWTFRAENLAAELERLKVAPAPRGRRARPTPALGRGMSRPG